MKTNKLWGGRFDKETDKLTDEFNASISFDKNFYREDITGSIAHAKMLGKQGILTKNETEQIVNGLETILNGLEEGKFKLNEELEDIHMNIEALLTNLIGDAGKKLHTGRSRNDQVATDFRLYIAHCVEDVQTELYSLLKLLLKLAKENLETLMPGYTHLQIAQPITYAHYLLCYFQMFYRDYKQFEIVKNQSLSELPLGAGALAGTTYNLDREYVAELLDFAGVKKNSIDAVSDRDFALNFLQASSLVMMHLSRFCEEIILYNSSEFNFYTLDDAYTTGSSIMPQKKNPDLAELIRGKTGRVYGNLISLFTTMKGLPLAYNKDMQEDKEPIIDSFETVVTSLKVLYKMLETLKINKSEMLNKMKNGFINATDLADYLVKKGEPFRNSHSIIGNIVLYCEKNNKRLDELTLEELNEFSDKFSTDVYNEIDLEKIINERELIGGPSPKTNRLIIARLDNLLDNLHNN